jgi:putative ABC transport system substrate-binding protein
MMKRRQFMTLLGGAVAWPVTAHAQQAVPVVGYLDVGAPEGRQSFVAAFFRGLAELGLVEGRNVTIDYRSAEQQPDRLPGMALDLVRKRVSVIATNGSATSALAAKAATATIPIVFVNGGDPVSSGLVASLNRPGDNVTGITFLSAELSGKRLDLLRDLVPSAMTIAHFEAPGMGPGASESLLTAARALGRQVFTLQIKDAGDLSAAFATAVGRGATVLMLAPNPLFVTNRKKILMLAAEHEIPAMYYDRVFAAEGGLISYGASIADANRLAGTYVGRILKGEKPADLPVQQSTKVELVINLKTAKTLGLTVPPAVLAIADEVIE